MVEILDTRTTSDTKVAVKVKFRQGTLDAEMQVGNITSSSVRPMPATLFPQSISVVIPAFNEQESIEKAVRDAVDFLPRRFEDWEILLVDDGSTDDTASITQRIAAAEPRVKLLKHPTNQGYGRAVATGFGVARHELVFYTDADNQFDIRELAGMVPLTLTADAVFGFRVQRFDLAVRRFLSWVYNHLVRVLFMVRVRDVDCAFKMFTRKVVDELTFESDDFFIDTELVVRTARLGFKYVEKGVRHYPRAAGKTTVRASHIPRTLWTVACMWLRINFPRKFNTTLTRTVDRR